MVISENMSFVESAIGYTRMWFIKQSPISTESQARAFRSIEGILGHIISSVPQDQRVFQAFNH